MINSFNCSNAWIENQLCPIENGKCCLDGLSLSILSSRVVSLPDNRNTRKLLSAKGSLDCKLVKAHCYTPLSNEYILQNNTDTYHRKRAPFITLFELRKQQKKECFNLLHRYRVLKKCKV